MIFRLKICSNVSISNEAATTMKTDEINNIEISSLKCLISATEVVFVFANVIPIAVTDKSPVPFMISSATEKVKITMTRTAGDFKNSGIIPASKSQAVNFPQPQPNTTEKIAAAKNNNSAVPSGSVAVK